MRLGQPRAGFGAHTPPAIFPPMFGLFGLGLAWRRAELVFNLPHGIADLILGAVTVLFLFAFVSYAAKVLRRPGVVVEDLRVLPGRAGIAAMILSVYLLAAVLVPMAPGIAHVLYWVGLAMHVVLVGLMARLLLTGPAEQRAVTPVFHLHFVGFIVSPLAGVPLGYVTFSTVILYASIVIAGLIWAFSLSQFLRQDVPPPLRPLLAIHLAPACLLGTVAGILGLWNITAVLFFVASGLLILMVSKARYITAAGFSPMWGAFTFPLAAYAGVALLVASSGHGEIFRVIGGVMLVVATLVVPVIAVKILQAWAKGGLAVKTNAARA